MGTLGKRVSILGIVTAAVVGCGRSKSEHGGATAEPNLQNATGAACSPAEAKECDAIRAQIVDLNRQLDEAIAQKDTVKSSRLTLEVNHQYELLNLLAEARDAASNSQDASAQLAQKIAALDSKYRQLSEQLEAELNKPAPKNPSGPSTVDTPPPGTTTPPNLTHTDGDLGGRVRVSSLLYAPSELDEVKKVRDAFGGDLYVAEGGGDVKADITPWAGYWYPFNRDDLYGSENSPLQKLDRTLIALGREGNTAGTESKLVSTMNPDHWEGRCSGWALASVRFPEPKEAVKPFPEVDISFSVSDQKALMTKVMENLVGNIIYDTYGSRYDGTDLTDGAIQDLRPEAFHQLFVSLLGEQHRAFVIDDDAGVAIWSKPVYRVVWNLKKDPAKANALLGTATVHKIANREVISEGPTDLNSSDEVSEVYEYRLYLDPTQTRAGKTKVIAGEWIGNSLATHPDFVTVPKLDAKPQSANAELEKNLDVVAKILGFSTE